ncbi:TonB-dependent receptor [Chelatococcus reniformis]|uniref:TonB-dependent receptor n=1 Tax=Chelatococcus reniformis TaxID=1494448 RepID=A0A916U4G5_9HYPH|nr:TonB-dependent receptor [Chelatococcus reniformis]GGC58516.1 TonB-dependent receptor [Chelatococcus reniformis]
MSFNRSRRLGLVASLGVPLTCLAGTARGEDVALPEITVSAPSPIVAPSTGAAPAEVPAGLLVIPSRTFAPVTVVERNEIERNQYLTLGDVTFSKPGTTSTTFAPGAGRPVIRGLDNFRVRLQENGVSTFDVSSFGEDHGVPTNPLTADRIEIIRGPATLRFGSQAIGGVVDVTNNRVPSALPPGGITARATGGVNSVNRGYDTAGTIDAGAGNVAVHADYFAQKGGDYRIPGGTQANSGFDTRGVAIGGSVILDSGFAGIAYSHVNSIYEIPGGESAANRTRIDMVQDKVVAKGEIRPPTEYIDAIRFWAGASNYRHFEIGAPHTEHGHDHGDDHNHDHDHAEGPLAALGDQIHSTFKSQEQEARVEVQHKTFTTPFGALSGSVGLQVAHQSLGTSGEAGGLLAPAQTKTAAVYLFEELALSDTLKLQAAGRIERASISGTADIFPGSYLPTSEDPLQTLHRNRDFAPKSISAGILKVLPWWNIVATLNAQYVERAPSAPELFSKGPHEASGTFEIGDPNLNIERARTVEFSLKKGDGPFRFEASVYYTKFSGFIYKRLTGIMCGETFATCGVEDELTQIAYAQQNATFKGAEVIGQYDVMPLGAGVIGVEGQYDIVQAKFADGTYVPRLPPQRLGGALYFRSDEWFAKIGLLHAYAQNDVASYETRTPGYNLLKAEVNYTRKLAANQFGLTEVSFGVVGDNLLNDDIRNSVSFKKDEVLLPGRGVKAYASVRF